jgi:hypothetical protein
MQLIDLRLIEKSCKILSTAVRDGMKVNRRAKWASVFYWIGVAMTLSSIALVLSGNTKWGATVEHTNFPLAWKFAIVAVLAFLAGEICLPAFPFNREKDSEARHSLKHTPYEI